jgi:hypothetical protein
VSTPIGDQSVDLLQQRRFLVGVSDSRIFVQEPRRAGLSGRLAAWPPASLRAIRIDYYVIFAAYERVGRRSKPLASEAGEPIPGPQGIARSSAKHVRCLAAVRHQPAIVHAMVARVTSRGSTPFPRERAVPAGARRPPGSTPFPREHAVPARARRSRREHAVPPEARRSRESTPFPRPPL